MYGKKRLGPNIDSCGTPQIDSDNHEKELSNDSY